jgi:hypothetical protein
MRGVAKCVLFAACASSTLGFVSSCPYYDRSCCASPAITVRVIDANTGDPVTNATVTASDGVTTETLGLYSNTGAPCAVPFADYRGVGRAGSYTVRVEAEGYESVVIESILVPENTTEGAACGFIAVDWLVKLNVAP